MLSLCGSYIFHLKLADSCNMLVVADPATITPHKKQPIEVRVLIKQSLDSSTPMTGTKGEWGAKNLDRDWWLTWPKPAIELRSRVRARSLVLFPLSPFLLSCVVRTTISTSYTSSQTLTEQCDCSTEKQLGRAITQSCPKREKREMKGSLETLDLPCCSIAGLSYSSHKQRQSCRNAVLIHCESMARQAVNMRAKGQCV